MKARKLLNRLARTTSGEWEYDKTHISFRALGWLRMDELAVFRTLLMGKKLLRMGDQVRVLRSFATVTDGGWVVNNDAFARTEIGRRSFSHRIKRLWRVIPEHIQVMNVKTKKEKDLIKNYIRGINCEWILWGRGEMPELED